MKNSQISEDATNGLIRACPTCGLDTSAEVFIFQEPQLCTFDVRAIGNQNDPVD